VGGNGGCEDTQNAGKYIHISTSCTRALFPDTLTLRYTLFLSPPLCVCVCVCVCACVRVSSKHSPANSTDRSFSSSFPSYITKKYNVGLNFENLRLL
jgi:hypothetical protein